MVVNGRTDSTIRISPTTAERVWEAVRATGYVANPVAQRLAHGRNQLLGVFTHEAVFPVDQSSFYHPFLVGIEREAELRGYDIILFTSAHGDDGRRRIFRNGSNRLLVASGAVLLGWPEDREEIRRLADSSYPFTYVGRREVEGFEIPFAAADYVSATGEIVDHLVELGHGRILYVGSLPEREAVADRWRGFVAGMQRHGLALPGPTRSRIDPHEVDSDRIRQWIAAGWTAVIVEDDLLARPLLEVARDAGIGVPGELSVALLGDLLTPDGAPVDWTTFRIPRFDMGRHAAALLVDSLEETGDPSRRQVVLPCSFSPGSTTGPPRR
jgi:DNA-binding LacI/PurR family transcriptional regulator